MKKVSNYIPHSKLSGKLWKNNSIIKNEVSEKLNNIADSFIEYLGIYVDIIDITITGSYANYNYTPYSDLDLHIVIDFNKVNDDIDLVEEFFNAKEKYWKFSHDITVKGIEVEIYPQNSNDSQVSAGVYSLLSDKWISKPKKNKKKVDVESIKRKVDIIKKEIKLSLKLAKKINHIEPIKRILKKLKRMRKSGLERAGELSDENITYKILRDDGYLQKLFDTSNNITDIKLSLK